MVRIFAGFVAFVLALMTLVSPVSAKPQSAGETGALAHLEKWIGKDASANVDEIWDDPDLRKALVKVLGREESQYLFSIAHSMITPTVAKQGNILWFGSKVSRSFPDEFRYVYIDLSKNKLYVLVGHGAPDGSSSVLWFGTGKPKRLDSKKFWGWEEGLNLAIAGGP